MNKYYKIKRFKKELKLYTLHGKKWNVQVTHKITLSNNDTENILKCNEKLCDKNLVCIKRVTKRIKLFNTYLYINTLYGGELK